MEQPVARPALDRLGRRSEQFALSTIRPGWSDRCGRAAAGAPVGFRPARRHPRPRPPDSRRRTGVRGCSQRSPVCVGCQVRLHGVGVRSAIRDPNGHPGLPSRRCRPHPALLRRHQSKPLRNRRCHRRTDLEDQGRRPPVGDTHGFARALRGTAVSRRQFDRRVHRSIRRILLLQLSRKCPSRRRFQRGEDLEDPHDSGRAATPVAQCQGSHASWPRRSGHLVRANDRRQAAALVRHHWRQLLRSADRRQRRNHRLRPRVRRAALVAAIHRGRRLQHGLQFQRRRRELPAG